MHEDFDTSAPPSTPPSPGAPLATHRMLATQRMLEVGVWLLLIVAVSVIFISTVFGPAAAAPSGGSESMEMRFQAQYAIGVHKLYGDFGLDLGESLGDQLLSQIQGMATTPAKELYAVPLMAELQGFDQALEEIERIGETDDLPEDLRQDLDLLARLYVGERITDEERITDGERAGFLERRGWFARLALSSGAEVEDPERRAVLAEAVRIALVMIAMAVVLSGATLVGCTLFVLALVLARRHGFRPKYQPLGETADPGSTEFDPHVPRAILAHRRLPFLETLVVFILGMSLVVPAFILLLMWLTGLEDVPLILTVLAAPALLWPWLRGVSTREVCQAYGWYRGAGVLKEIGCGLLAYVAGAPILITGILISALLSRLVEAPAHHPIMDEVSGAGPWGILTIYLVACVSAPLLEELVFRGGFYHYLRSRWNMWASAFIVSVVFAFIHPQGLLGLPPLIALAMILAFIREWRGSLIGSIAVHAVHNGMATTALFLLLG